MMLSVSGSAKERRCEIDPLLPAAYELPLNKMVQGPTVKLYSILKC